MSDSIDRVFVKAITTIRALSSRSNYGSLPRPPAENRIRLYGLYKQATEGDVEGIMPRPIGFTIEDEGAKKKWDAWKREEGISKTEAKRRYISYLIDTMKIYASGTLEARELLSELEYLWDQIKDLQFNSDEENDHPIPLPSRSPLFSQADQSDKFSTGTPSIVPNTQYRNNLQKIYSHSRRSTMLSINDYVNQQRQQSTSAAAGQATGISGVGTASVYSLPLSEAPRYGTQSARSLPRNPIQNAPNVAPVASNSSGEFKTWQNEINAVIRKLSHEYDSNRRAEGFRGSLPGNIPEDDEQDLNSILKLRILRILRIVGKNSLHFLKNFSISLLAILFLTWLAKKNVIVKRTLVDVPSAAGASNKQAQELVINMIINTDENKWFIRLLSFLNSFVGFV
ncbi:uncharacterized protein CANTADRAFT_22484 [Suhomyces tanzawaensis NRRL Y-17324]|uniref:ACB domain-containing protein n=1 Tax=Suhomyces tanzawaensis NRRL Y-17324 TaxID=984487 RepID=A0A1E4SGF1_9ASCO|nr:uncharacterized protein CANTADRAFT_22484 [Suhomyces tanzawaensis NRRL Y-17324]ODV78492.1 hypothetical protein CANTADRAFT_22484 [Suhomyces tanzawaensis NRRL Y-17324]